MLLRMSQRLSRSNAGTEAGRSSGNQGPPDHVSVGTGPIEAAHRDTRGSSGGILGMGHGRENLEEEDEKDNPIVALEPEDEKREATKKMSIRGGSSLDKTSGAQKESLFKQEKEYLAQREQQHILKAEEYHVIKTKDFNVVGKLR